MLTKNQWLWCANHHRGIKNTTIAVISILAMLYCYRFLEIFWWNNKIPEQYMPKPSQKVKFNCLTHDDLEMAIPSANKIISLKGDFRNYVPAPLERTDARGLLLEKYPTQVLGSEILGKRPECLGAIIADRQHWPGPYAILIVDRNTGKTIFRIARLDGSLTR